MDVTNWIRLLDKPHRSLASILTYINDDALPRLLEHGSQAKVPMATLARYMATWGYSYRKQGKDVYYDGHERQDVVAYRYDWACRMVALRRRMETYDIDDVTIVVPPVDAPTAEYKRLVMVTHDECTFYANDGKNVLWLRDDETVLRNKNPGRSIMVSEFQCPCHGTMRGIVKDANGNDVAATSRQLFFAGGKQDGWWTSDNLVAQLKDQAIPLFEQMHPGCQGVFLFDQSSNHKAWARDALVATRLAYKPYDIAVDGVENPGIKYRFKDTSFPSIEDPNSMINQSFYATEVREKKKKKKTNEFGEVVYAKRKGTQTEVVTFFKGIERIMIERGFWTKADVARAKKRKTRSSKTNTAIKCILGPCSDGPSDSTWCCAVHILQDEPDFKAQKSALHEVLHAAGHIYELYPKFHCETNWIERYWGQAKVNYTHV